MCLLMLNKWTPRIHMILMTANIIEIRILVMMLWQVVHHIVFTLPPIISASHTFKSSETKISNICNWREQIKYRAVFVNIHHISEAAQLLLIRNYLLQITQRRNQTWWNLSWALQVLFKDSDLSFMYCIMLAILIIPSAIINFWIVLIQYSNTECVMRVCLLLLLLFQIEMWSSWNLRHHWELLTLLKVSKHFLKAVMI